MEKNAESITQTVIEAAKSGDLTAARMILDRLAPHAKERPVSVDLPDTSTVEGINAAQQAILQAVAAGDLLPGEGTALAGIVEARRKSIETLQLDLRIAALEARNVTT
jgi:transcription elongation factor